MLKSSIEPTFRLSEKFLEQYKGKQPNWGFGDLSYFTYKRTYARVKENGEHEEFVDTLERVVNGCYRTQEKHAKGNGLSWNALKAQYSAQEMFRRMWDFKFLPPGRGLWMMGTSHVEKVGSAALNNCGFINTRDISVELGEPFAWAMDMLMLGVGIGFDTKGASTVKIIKPKIAEFDFVDAISSNIYVIPDTREGWVESVRLLINSYQDGRFIDFDYSNIREAGLPIKGFGGTSSGPQPLIDAHADIRTLLDAAIGNPITSVIIVDIMNLIGRCVVAGNVRRSAELAIGELEDTAYCDMKDYRLFSKELLSHRWASNNSVFVKPDSNFESLKERILLNGEPGLIFLDNARHYGRFKDGYLPETDRRYDHVDGFNPCAEQNLESHELCCLVETFPSEHESLEDYLRTLKFAYLYAKSVTLIPTHDERTNSVIMRNRRIGTSMSGIQQAINKFGRNTFFTKFCDSGYETIKKWDRVYSRWLGVPESIRVTTVKPSGTVSLLAGVWPGVHFTHSESYYRTVRLAANSVYVKPLLDAGYRIECSVNDYKKLQEAWNSSFGEGISDSVAQDICTTNFNSPNYTNLLTWLSLSGTTLVVYFPVVEKNYNKSKFDVSLWEQLSTVREMQYFWADNAVSCTVTVKDTEQADLIPAIEFVAPHVKTLSFLPLTNHQYAQAPYTSCKKEEVLSYQSKLDKLDLSNISNQKIAGSKFCDGDKCEI